MSTEPALDISESEHSDPWDRLFTAHSKFLNDLDCIYEMFRLVSPVLERKDAERESHIKQLGTDFEEDGKAGRKFTKIEDVQEFFQHMRRIKTADRMFRQNIIVSIVSRFDEFLMVMLRSAFEENTSWLKNPEKTVSYKQLFEIASLDEFVAELIRKEVDQLMRGSHHSQVGLLDSKLKLGIEAEFKRWIEFLEITERRNLFVHGGGVVSSVYQDNADRFGFPRTEERRLGAPDEYVSTAIDVFYELSVRVVHGVTRRLFPACFKEADMFLNNVSVELLSDQRWQLAENIFSYAMGIPEKLRDRNETYYYNLINFCIARKFGGKETASYIESVNWSPLHPKYHFAIAVLEDRFVDAAQMMRTDAIQQKVSKNDFMTWPLLREFRHTETFQDAFRDIFDEDFQADLLQKAKEELEQQDSDSDVLSIAKFEAQYPMDDKELTRQLANRYTDFKADDVYHSIRKPLMSKRQFTNRRYLEPGNLQSQFKDYYSPKIIDEFDKHYTVKSESD